ncbi:MAG: chromosomal replication initiator protein DnaA [candidate division WOR-3 bacterium]
MEPRNQKEFNWKEIKEKLQKEVNESAFKAWFANMELEALYDKDVYFNIPNTFTQNWIKEHFMDDLNAIIKEVTGKTYNIHFLVNKNMPQEKPQEELQPRIQKPLLHDKYTFENFVVGDNNRLAYAAAIAVSNAPGREYNPLFIYGGVGLGKTHLLQATGNRVYSRYPNLKILYTQAEEFLNEMIKSIQEYSTVQFKQKYREIDLLLIDDVHFLAGKERLQEEFFHTFNALFEAKKQIVITSDRPPREISGLEERVISRFQWGLMVDLQPPDFETRLAILRSKIQSNNIQIDDSVINYIASNIKTNIRELEGCLIKLLAYASIYKTDITIDLAKKVLRDFIKEKDKKVTLEKIISSVAEFYNIDIEELKGNKRSKNVAFARQIAIYLSRNLTNLSLKEIGDNFGKRDHSTILHSINKIDYLIKKDNKIKDNISTIKNKLMET